MQASVRILVSALFSAGLDLVFGKRLFVRPFGQSTSSESLYHYKRSVRNVTACALYSFLVCLIKNEREVNDKETHSDDWEVL